MSVLEASAQPLDQTQVDPVDLISNQQQPTQLGVHIPSPVPNKCLEQNEAPPSTGGKRNKQVDVPKSTILDAAHDDDDDRLVA